MSFAYIGEAKTGSEFITYLRSYDFGTVPPSFVVIHHTYNPDASWAPISGNKSTYWDRNESGLTADQIKAKRKPQLDSIKNYYEDSKGWTTGPHLFVDERWIWLFTPLYEVGTHAASGNSYTDAHGLHYSIGIECVGYFERHGWPSTMQQLLQVAVQGLRSRLGTFEIAYVEAPINRPDLHDNSISFHADYNKPACPGAVITPQYAIPILQKPYAADYLQFAITAPCAVFTARAPDAPLAGGPHNGQTRLLEGQIVNCGDITDGWLWISDSSSSAPGIGFIPQSYARPV